jgi:hypothetical protein
MNTNTAPASPVHAPSTSTSSGLFGRKSRRNLLLALVGIFVVLPLMIAFAVAVIPGL